MLLKMVVFVDGVSEGPVPGPLPDASGAGMILFIGDEDLEVARTEPLPDASGAGMILFIGDEDREVARTGLK